MVKYEIVCILSGEMSEEEVKEAEGNITSLLNSNEAQSTQTKIWGKRTLAYPINKNDEGYYIQANFDMSEDKIKNVDNSLRFDQKIIRYLIVKDDLFGKVPSKRKKKETTVES
ncbi:MAG: 30S ribosomal protein S6 [Chloroflexi bacterium]|nr:30S ribosomal protein S6 [Chloroflexota bacterium]